MHHHKLTITKGYKYLPSIGSLIVDTLEGNVPSNIRGVVKWNPAGAVNRNWGDKLGRYGGPNKVMDFQHVKEWTNFEERNISKL